MRLQGGDSISTVGVGAPEDSCSRKQQGGHWPVPRPLLRARCRPPSSPQTCLPCALPLSWLLTHNQGARRRARSTLSQWPPCSGSHDSCERPLALRPRPSTSMPVACGHPARC